MYPDWLYECSSLIACADESLFTATVSFKEQAVAALAPRPSLMYRPSTDSSSSQASKSTASISRRRSDASSMPLRPDGVFRDIQLSLFGWGDARQEASLSYQITSNGGTIVALSDANQFACVCADGSRPTRSDLRLVSPRWVNECLASSQLFDPISKTIFSPSMGQLPLLLATKLCVYITEKEQAKHDEIAELAKLCGIRFGSRSETRTPVSAVTHFIFHDLVSVNRRRDLVPVARKNGKHVVSFEWLKETFLLGTKQDEAKFDISEALDAPALPPPTLPSPDDVASLLADVVVTICPSLDASVAQLVASMGGQISVEEGHTCGPNRVRISRTATCRCETVSESWLRECETQKRVVSRHTFLLRVDDDIDQLMIEKDQRSSVQWENRKAKTLAKQVSQ